MKKTNDIIILRNKMTAILVVTSPTVMVLVAAAAMFSTAVAKKRYYNVAHLHNTRHTWSSKGTESAVQEFSIMCSCHYSIHT